MSYLNSFSGNDVTVSPSSTSYFSDPSSGLDPKLFEGMHLRPWVRNSIVRMLFEHLAVLYNSPNRWVSAWLAGSGVSYQWESVREPGDLDCLVGLDYIAFRRSNSDYSGLSDLEIARMFNESFHDDLMPDTADWEGYELTFYVNPQSNIVDINPYAAYDLINDEWTVEPTRSQNPPYSRVWEQRTSKDEETAVALVRKYSQAYSEFKNSLNNPITRVNAERKLQLAIDQASTFFEELHTGRKTAFSKTGAGYADFNNYRWQAGKQSGIVQALKLIKDYRDEARKTNDLELYGVEMPTPDTLIRRSATYRVTQ